MRSRLPAWAENQGSIAAAADQPMNIVASIRRKAAP
jgi:hypothetical protein